MIRQRNQQKLQTDWTSHHPEQILPEQMKLEEYVHNT